MKEKVDFTGVESTMLTTLYLKALESRSPNSILGDTPAAEVVERIDYDFPSLIPRGGSGNRFMVAMRAKQLDDWAVEFLDRHPDATVLHLGCGLDSRALRLGPPAGVRWYDVDLPDVIALRRRIYRDMPDSYRTIGASVTESAWLEDVPGDSPVLVIAEGLLPYFTEEDVARMLGRFTERFDAGELICDGFAPWAARASRGVLARKGFPPFLFALGDGQEMTRLNPHLTPVEQVSVMAGFAQISEPANRRLFRVMHSMRWSRNLYRLFRFTF